MNAVESVLSTYKNAVAEKNVDMMVGLFDEQILFVDVWDQWSVSGLGAWRSTVQEWFGSLGTDRVVVDFEILQETATETLASVVAFVDYAAFNPDGAKLRSHRERQTWVISVKPEGWKIVHCHNSIPIDSSTGKVRSE